MITYLEALQTLDESVSCVSVRFSRNSPEYFYLTREKLVVGDLLLVPIALHFSGLPLAVAEVCEVSPRMVRGRDLKWVARKLDVDAENATKQQMEHDDCAEAFTRHCARKEMERVLADLDLPKALHDKVTGLKKINLKKEG